MEELRDAAINPSKRMLRVRGSLCGCVITGTDKTRSGYGNGDCLFFDFRRRVFAVADGSERHPRASRELLVRLAGSLSRGGAPGTAAEWRAMINRDVYAGQKFQHKTTFSCAAVREDAGDVTLVVSHGGDSAVMVLDSGDGAVLFRTGRDMCFAGRSPEISDVSEYRLPGRRCRVFIASDGFGDLFRYCVRKSLLPGIADMFREWTVDRIGDELLAVLTGNAGRFEHDDIGFIILDPFALEGAAGPAVLIGGTTPREEERINAGGPDDDRERWVPAARWEENAAALEERGIVMVGT